MRGTRGSALIYVLLMALASSAVVIAAIGASTAGYTSQVRNERQAMADAAFDGAVEQISTDCSAGTLTVPSTRLITIGSVECNLSVSDNGAAIPGSLLVQGTMKVKDATYRKTRVIGRSLPPDPFYYVLFSNTSVSTTQAVITNGPAGGGDVAVNGNLTLSHASSQINGDVEATGAIVPSSVYVSGTKTESAPGVPFTSIPIILIPALNPYLIEAVLQLPGLIIDGLNLGTGYPLAYALLATQLKGTITGKGTIYFPGNLTITGDMYYGNSNSRVAIIAYGNITVNGNVSHLVGHIYARGSITFLGPTAKNLDSGSIVANSLSIQAPLVLNHDASIWTDPTEGYRLKLPGYWP